MEGIIQGRLAYSRRQIIKYLREVAPDHTRPISDKDLLSRIGFYMEEASQYGVSQERAYGQWALMQITSNDKFGAIKGVRRIMSDTSMRETPDEKVDKFADRIVDLYGDGS